MQCINIVNYIDYVSKQHITDAYLLLSNMHVMCKKHIILPEYHTLFITVLSVDTVLSIDISREVYSLLMDCDGNKYFEG